MHTSKPSKSVEKMSTDITADMRRYVIAAAGQRGWHDNIKSLLHRASVRLGISPRRAKAFYYGEARIISAQEYIAVSERVAVLERLAKENEKQNALLRQGGASILGASGALWSAEISSDSPEVPPELDAADV